MRNHEIREALKSEPKARKGDLFNMTMIAEEGVLARDRSLTGTDHAVLRFLVHITDRDGYSVATVEQIARETHRSKAGVSAAISKHVAAGRMQRVGRSGFWMRHHLITPQNKWSR